MAENIGPKIGLEGEREYRNALKNVIAETKAYKSETEKLAASLDSGGDKIKKYSEYHEKLGAQIEAQKRKVDLLKEA